MKLYKVTYEHEVIITYEALVEADSKEEAMRKISECDFISEEEIDYQGMYIRPQHAELIED